LGSLKEACGLQKMIEVSSGFSMGHPVPPKNHG